MPSPNPMGDESIIAAGHITERRFYKSDDEFHRALCSKGPPCPKCGGKARWFVFKFISACFRDYAVKCRKGCHSEFASDPLCAFDYHTGALVAPLSRQEELKCL